MPSGHHTFQFGIHPFANDKTKTMRYFPRKSQGFRWFFPMDRENLEETNVLTSSYTGWWLTYPSEKYEGQ